MKLKRQTKLYNITYNDEYELNEEFSKEKKKKPDKR